MSWFMWCLLFFILSTSSFIQHLICCCCCCCCCCLVDYTIVLVFCVLEVRFEAMEDLFYLHPTAVVCGCCPEAGLLGLRVLHTHRGAGGGGGGGGASYPTGANAGAGGGGGGGGGNNHSVLGYTGAAGAAATGWWGLNSISIDPQQQQPLGAGGNRGPNSYSSYGDRVQLAPLFLLESSYGSTDGPPGSLGAGGVGSRGYGGRGLGPGSGLGLGPGPGRSNGAGGTGGAVGVGGAFWDDSEDGEDSLDASSLHRYSAGMRESEFSYLYEDEPLVASFNLNIL
jgi:hypothetical protein